MKPVREKVIEHTVYYWKRKTKRGDGVKQANELYPSPQRVLSARELIHLLLSNIGIFHSVYVVCLLENTRPSWQHPELVDEFGEAHYRSCTTAETEEKDSVRTMRPVGIDELIAFQHVS